MEFYPEGMNAELDRQFTTPEALRRAMMQGSVLESRVLLCDREHNLHVDLGAMRGIIPREEGAVGIDDGTVRDIALISKVGKRVCFSILGFQREDDGPFTAILSRRAVQLRCKAEFLDTLEPGDVIPARVTHLEKFGAFIDVGAGLPTIDLMRTGANIVRLRKAAGLTVHDLQMVFGFNSPQAIYKWQNGAALPTVDNLIVLAALLHVRIDDILVTDNAVA